MELEDMAKLIPPPPADMVDWLKKKGCFRKKWLIFKCGYFTNPLSGEKEKVLDVVCTACGESFKVRRTENCEERAPEGCSGWALRPPERCYCGSVGDTVVEDGKETICPECGAKVIGKHTSNVTTCFDNEWPLVISRVGDYLILAGYRVNRACKKDGSSTIRVNPYEANVFEANGKRGYRFCGWFSSGMMFGARTYVNEWMPRKRYADEYGIGKYIYLTDRNVFRGTSFENCKLSRYMRAAGAGNYPIGYLRLFQQHPQVENLLVQGCGGIVRDIVRDKGERPHYSDACPVGTINWREKSPRRMLGLSKPDFDFIRAQKVETKQILTFRKLREQDPKASAEDIVGFIQVFSYEAEKMAKLPDMWRVARYCRKQAGKGENPETVYRRWNDYIKMAVIEGYDANAPEIRFPPHLNAAHDRMVAVQKCREQEGRKKQFQKMYERCRPYIWEKDGLLIRPAMSEEELIREGKLLHHCVGGYGPEHCGGDPIFFIRRAEDPDTPYYTLQLDLVNLRVIQIHGDHNNMPGWPPKPPEIDAFGEEWCERVVRAAVRKNQNRERVRERAIA